MAMRDTLLAFVAKIHKEQAGKAPSVDEGRRLFKGSITPELTGPAANVARVEEVVIPFSEEERVAARLYANSREPRLPLILYYHGGGFVRGDLDVYDPLCRALALSSGALILSVAYRLAPEHPYPAGRDDAYRALEWASLHAVKLGGDPNRIIIAGDSAGGNLAAVCALLARNRNGPKLMGQILIYPVLDLTCQSTSMTMREGDCCLTRDSLMGDYKLYCSEGEDLTNPELSPLFAHNLENLPEAMIITAEYDTLRDEAEEYAAKLEESGNEVVLIQYDGMIHGFLMMGALVPEAQKAIDAIGDHVKRLTQETIIKNLLPSGRSG